ncbi:hypothetical protein ACVWZV_005645 [Bradyrhizobium sp. GM5.1]
MLESTSGMRQIDVNLRPIAKIYTLKFLTEWIFYSEQLLKRS